MVPTLCTVTYNTDQKDKNARHHQKDVKNKKKNK
jgi:hypothetical protein